MNKFQPVDFQDLDDLFAFLPSSELEILQVLRQLIYECIPEVKEKLSYNVPFFRAKKTICFIWPGSVPWGGTFEGVQFGFAKGHLLLNDDGYLDSGKRKYVRTKTFRSTKEIDFDRLRALLYEASMIDSEG
ncbi:DUF1801 domain-containing protein [Roseivirga misakiensis]|uniref:YdhG-like domain-containing protein n=1 Tax=Roseivirga misakiensis TaxID=1563681 RepID=A0A1E5T6L9_9BACT|nr:DUF1801 domain-containing protein [Roseivirga misakiensis]OEK07010.1 hypothetical protein BFP71_04950 [Roseivirga misakiensis]